MSIRLDRINQLIKEELATMIQLELKDPRLSAMISVTRVRTSPDLKRADVYVSVLADEAGTLKALQALQKATGFLRHELGERIRLRHLPELAIHHDRSLAEGTKVLGIISKLEQEGGQE